MQVQLTLTTIVSPALRNPAKEIRTNFFVNKLSVLRNLQSTKLSTITCNFMFCRSLKSHILFNTASMISVAKRAGQKRKKFNIKLNETEADAIRGSSAQSNVTTTALVGPKYQGRDRKIGTPVKMSEPVKAEHSFVLKALIECIGARLSSEVIIMKLSQQSEWRGGMGHSSKVLEICFLQRHIVENFNLGKCFITDQKLDISLFGYILPGFHCEIYSLGPKSYFDLNY